MLGHDQKTIAEPENQYQDNAVFFLRDETCNINNKVLGYQVLSHSTNTTECDMQTWVKDMVNFRPSEEILINKDMSATLKDL